MVTTTIVSEDSAASNFMDRDAMREAAGAS
jgi:hypothetical protein